MISVTLHTIVIVLIAHFLRPDAPAASGEETDRWITIRFSPQVAVKTQPAPTPRTPEKKTSPERRDRTAVAPKPQETPLEPDVEARDPQDLERHFDLVAPPLKKRAETSPAIGVGARGVTAPSRKGQRYFANRGAGKAAALARFGGSSGTEDAVFRGLKWLAAHQDKDGSWDADGFQRHCAEFNPCAVKGLPQFDVGVSGLAVLAFLGAGYSPIEESPFQDVVRRGLEALLDAQRPDGLFGGRVEKSFYNHSIATFAVAEAYGMTGETRYRDACGKALLLSASAQQGRGGWDYTREPTGRNDLSVTGWHVMAIAAAQNVGIPIPQGVLEQLRSYLESSVSRTGKAEYADDVASRGRTSHAMAAVALLSRLYLGVPANDSAILGAAATLVKNPPEFGKSYDWHLTSQSSYYWYYGTLALFHVGGSQWDAWNHFLKQELLRRQSRRDHEDGSWSPDGSWVGLSGGRIAATAFHVLSLEVYYRYPPLHAYKSGREE